MDTLHKKLSEIRDLRADELDLVGGADEYHNQTVFTNPYNTHSLDAAGHDNTDDGYVQIFYD